MHLICFTKIKYHIILLYTDGKNVYTDGYNWNYSEICVCFFSGLMWIYVSDLYRCFKLTDICLAFNQLGQEWNCLQKKKKNEQEIIPYCFYCKNDHLVDSWILRDLTIVGTSRSVVVKIISVVRIPSETSISQDL